MINYKPHLSIAWPFSIFAQIQVPKFAPNDSLEVGAFTQVGQDNLLTQKHFHQVLSVIQVEATNFALSIVIMRVHPSSSGI